MNEDEEPGVTRHRAAISAHRGGSEDAPPATWDAYKASVETGAQYVEFDIRRTEDGELVVYHDDRVAHTGPELATIGYSELCDRAGYQVPKVGEVMDLVSGRATGHLDLKEIGYEDEVISLARDVFAEDFVATSLEDVSIATIKRDFPWVRAALSLGRDLADLPWRQRLPVRRSELYPLRRIRDCGADWVAVNHRLARRGVLAQCARNGIGAMVWTVNEDALIGDLLADRRVHVLITDRPRHAVGIRGEAG